MSTGMTWASHWGVGRRGHGHAREEWGRHGRGRASFGGEKIYKIAKTMIY